MLFSSSRLDTTPPSTAPKVWLRTSVPARKPAITQFAFASSSVTPMAVSPSAGSGPITANEDALPLVEALDGGAEAEPHELLLVVVRDLLDDAY